MHKLQSFLLAVSLAACSSNRPAPAKPTTDCAESTEVATASSGTAGPATTNTPGADASKPMTKEELDQRERDLDKHHLPGPPLKPGCSKSPAVAQPTNGPTTPAPAP